MPSRQERRRLSVASWWPRVGRRVMYLQLAPSGARVAACTRAPKLHLLILDLQQYIQHHRATTESRVRCVRCQESAHPVTMATICRLDRTHVRTSHYLSSNTMTPTHALMSTL